MKLKELEKLATEISTREKDRRQAIADRIKDATAKLETLRAQANEMAQAGDFDGYADCMENQRKQADILHLAESMSKRTAEQSDSDKKAAQEFLRKAQQAFDEDTAADWKELERQAIKTAEIAQRIRDKYNTAEQCSNTVFGAYQTTAVSPTITAPLSLCNSAESLPKQFENMRDFKKKGINVL